MGWLGRGILAIVLTVVALSALGADRGPSTAEERERLLKAAELIQKKPLSPDARKEGTWALQWITDVPDINVTVCGSFSPHYKYEAQMMASDVISMGAFIVKNPKKVKDQSAVWRAGVEGMLSTYQMIVRKNSGARDDFYDDLLEQQHDEDLATFMQEFGLRCYASSGKKGRI